MFNRRNVEVRQRNTFQLTIYTKILQNDIPIPVKFKKKCLSAPSAIAMLCCCFKLLTTLKKCKTSIFLDATSAL